MANLTIVSPKIPFPPRSDGISVRLAPILSYLGERHKVQLIAVGDTRPKDIVDTDRTREYCTELLEILPTESRGPLRRKLRVLADTLDSSRAPYELYQHASPFIADTVAKHACRHGADLILWVNQFSDTLSLYRTNSPGIPSVFDWIDSPSLHLSRIEPASWFRSSRVQRLRSWERHINACCDWAIYISGVDAAFAGAKTGISTLPNGVLDDMPQSAALPSKTGPGFTIGFLGNMGYQPNIRAAIRLHDKIFQPLSSEVDGLKLKIIGRWPPPAVQRLAAENVEITGSVDSIWPHLNSCDSMVFPMETGAGLQNKVLESMFANCSIVASPICLAPFGAAADTCAIQATTDDEFRAAIRALASSPQRNGLLAKRAKDYVREFNWETILPRYEETLLQAVERGQRSKAAVAA